MKFGLFTLFPSGKNIYSVLIYDYLKKPVLPVTVTDQISMWYEERNRFKFTEGVFYGQFNSEDDYQMLKNYAQVNRR